MTATIRAILALLLFCLSSFATQATAEDLDKRTVTCGEIIVDSVKVDNDLTCPGDGLIIGADDIVVDLGRHRFTGDGGVGDNGIDNSEGHSGVVVRFGEIAKFDRGVYVDATEATNNTFTALTLEDNQVGVYLEGADKNEVDGNFIYRSATAGILLDAGADENTISSNFIRDGQYAGIFLIDSDFNAITRNGKMMNNLYGVILRESSGNRISLNKKISANKGFGLHLSNSDSNRIEFNRMDENGGSGIELLADSSDNQLYRNAARSNKQVGIYVADSLRNKIHQNTLMKNVLDGVLLQNTTGTDAAGNKAIGNGFTGKDDPGDDAGLGMNATGGGPVTGEDNKAKRNDDPAECKNVTCNK